MSRTRAGLEHQTEIETETQSRAHKTAMRANNDWGKLRMKHGAAALHTLGTVGSGQWTMNEWSRARCFITGGH
jgi:hypothetical protein